MGNRRAADRPSLRPGIRLSSYASVRPRAVVVYPASCMARSRAGEAVARKGFGGVRWGVIWGTEEPRTVPAFSRGSVYRHMRLSGRVLSLFILLLAWPARGLTD